MVVLTLIAWWAGIGTVLRYTGVGGVAVYSCVILSAPLWGPRLAAVAGRAFLFFVAAGALGLALTVLLIYPWADARAPDAGSDDDDALNIAAESILAGDYPYSEPTYLGNPIAPLPGAVLLALPFVIGGTSAYQALVWVPALGAVIRRNATRERSLLILGIVSVCPGVAASIANGSSGFVNGIYVALASIAVVRWPNLGTGVFWGITLSSRALFWPIVPLVLIVVKTESGTRSAMRVAAAAVLAFVVVTVPFWIADPSRFTPLETIGKLTVGDSFSPLVGGAMYVAAFVVALWAVLRAPEFWSVIRACLVALAVPIIGITILAIRQYGIHVYGYYGYLLEVLPFAAVYAAATQERSVVLGGHDPQHLALQGDEDPIPNRTDTP